MDSIKLNFINQSQDTNNSDIVLFQKNVAEDFDAIATAWRVIKNCGPGDNHPFDYPLIPHVSCTDSWGNYTPQMAAHNGEAYEMVSSNSGDVLRTASRKASSSTLFEVHNGLTKDAIRACVFRDGKLCAQMGNLAPQQKAVFEFRPVLYIGAAAQVQEGAPLSSAVQSQITTALDLTGLASADIVMTGGGYAASLAFELKNITSV